MCSCVKCVHLGNGACGVKLLEMNSDGEMGKFVAYTDRLREHIASLMWIERKPIITHRYPLSYPQNVLTEAWLMLGGLDEPKRKAD